jgi:hypothetical protein
VRLSPVGTAATVRPISPVPDDDVECGAIGGMRIGRANRSTRRKPAPVSLCRQQISYDLTRAKTRAAGAYAQKQILINFNFGPCVLPALILFVHPVVTSPVMLGFRHSYCNLAIVTSTPVSPPYTSWTEDPRKDMWKCLQDVEINFSYQDHTYRYQLPRLWPWARFIVRMEVTFVDRPASSCIWYTGCFTTLGHNCRRWFPRSLWSKKFI